jgi:NADH-quinone oxidoreductase subunit N
VAGIAGLTRLLVEVFWPLPGWGDVLAVLAALTLVVGNCVAMLQEDVKRLLAYSGIAHAGFVLMALASVVRAGAPPVARGLSSFADQPALAAIGYYACAYALMTLGALVVVTLVEREHGGATLVSDHAGLASVRPALAAAMLVCLLSLGGMPPLAGFVGKWLVFQVTLEAGLTWLAVVAAATSVVAFYYYLRLVVQMYLQPARPGAPAPAGTAAQWVLVGAAAVGSLLLGVLPWLVLSPLQSASAAAALLR